MQLIAYLNFNGQCEEAFQFYEKALGGKITAMQPFAGTPAAQHAPPDWGKKILHASLTVGNAVIMGSDGTQEQFEPAKGMAVAIVIEEPAEAERVFHALAQKGTVQMPLAQTFWAERFGALVDQYGTPWMVNCEGKQK